MCKNRCQGDARASFSCCLARRSHFQPPPTALFLPLPRLSCTYASIQTAPHDASSHSQVHHRRPATSSHRIDVLPASRSLGSSLRQALEARPRTRAAARPGARPDPAPPSTTNDDETRSNCKCEREGVEWAAYFGEKTPGTSVGLCEYVPAPSNSLLALPVVVVSLPATHRSTR
jgi:hypothetical protein